jgi:sugar-specific transcriptional regulator TrmB
MDKEKLISEAELARQAGVSRHSAWVFLNKLEKKGYVFEHPGRRGRRVDPEEPEIARYIAKRHQDTADKAVVKALQAQTAASVRLAEALIKQNELRTANLRSKYVTKKLAIGFFDNLLNITQSVFSELPYKILNCLKASRVINPAPEQETAIIELLKGDLDNIFNNIKKDFELYKDLTAY